MTWKELDIQLKDYQNRILGNWYSKEKDGAMIFCSTDATYRNAHADLITIVDGKKTETRYYLFIGYNQDKICLNVGDDYSINPFIPQFLIENLTSQYLLLTLRIIKC